MRGELEERWSPKNMEIIDANVIQKYILNDDEILEGKVAKIIEMESVTSTIEVIAEVVYVLQRV